MADKNLRLDSRFSMIGAFWSPETPDTIMKGTLVSDEREINFITAPEYERPISIENGKRAIIVRDAQHEYVFLESSNLTQLTQQPQR